MMNQKKKEQAYDEALQVLIKIMQDCHALASARVAAAVKVLDILGDIHDQI